MLVISLSIIAHKLIWIQIVDFLPAKQKFFDKLKGLSKDIKNMFVIYSTYEPVMALDFFNRTLINQLSILNFKKESAQLKLFGLDYTLDTLRMKTLWSRLKINPI